jgi:hypothetical protein
MSTDVVYGKEMVTERREPREVSPEQCIGNSRGRRDAELTATIAGISRPGRIPAAFWRLAANEPHGL